MILFRADGNPNIGSGHVCRCLSLADAFRRKGNDSLFVMAEEDLKPLVEERGYQTRIIGGSYDRTEEEIPVILDLIREVKPLVFISDSYFVTTRYFLALREAGIPLWYVDDYGKNAFPADGVLNYNVYGPKLDYVSLYERENKKVPALLLGTQYAPLRDLYRGIPSRVINEKCKNVLISTGASDPLRLQKQLAEYLEMTNDQDGLCFHFLLTDLNQDKDLLLSLPKREERMVFHTGLRSLKEIMMSSDLAFAASGSTLYELCACGLPTINYALADNQLLGCQAFYDLKLMESCHDLRGRSDLGKVIFEAIFALAEDYPKRQYLSQKMQECVDGFGADRFADFVLKQGT